MNLWCVGMEKGTEEAASTLGILTWSLFRVIEEHRLEGTRQSPEVLSHLSCSVFHEQSSVASEICSLDGTWGKKGLVLVVCEVDTGIFC